MRKALTKKKLIFTIAGLVLLTFCIPASSHAAGVILVPAAGLAIWGVTVVATGVAALFKGEDRQDEEARVQQEPMKQTRTSDSSVRPGAPNPLPNEG